MHERWRKLNMLNLEGQTEYMCQNCGRRTSEPVAQGCPTVPGQMPCEHWPMDPLQWLESRRAIEPGSVVFSGHVFFDNGKHAEVITPLSEEMATQLVAVHAARKLRKGAKKKKDSEGLQEVSTRIISDMTEKELTACHQELLSRNGDITLEQAMKSNFGIPRMMHDLKNTMYKNTPSNSPPGIGGIAGGALGAAAGSGLFGTSRRSELESTIHAHALPVNASQHADPRSWVTSQVEIQLPADISDAALERAKDILKRDMSK